MCGELQERSYGFKNIKELFRFLKSKNVYSMKQKDLVLTIIFLNKQVDVFISDSKYKWTRFVDLCFSQNNDFSNYSHLQYSKLIVDNNTTDIFPVHCNLFKLFFTISISTASMKRVL